jgi:hypothetical protein
MLLAASCGGSSPSLPAFFYEAMGVVVAFSLARFSLLKISHGAFTIILLAFLSYSGIVLTQSIAIQACIVQKGHAAS